MDVKTYWVGDRPGGAWVFQVLDQKTAQPESLGSYQAARTLLVDSDNRLVELPEQNTVITDANNGEVTFFWPSESVFTKPGRYVIQVQLIGGTSTRTTSEQHILVRGLGGVTK